MNSVGESAGLSHESLFRAGKRAPAPGKLRGRSAGLRRFLAETCGFSAGISEKPQIPPKSGVGLRYRKRQGEEGKIE